MLMGNGNGDSGGQDGQDGQHRMHLSRNSSECGNGTGGSRHELGG